MALFQPGGRIAVVEMYGTIGGAVRPAVFESLLTLVRRSKRVRAVVLDIDSPGGSAPASEDLYQSVARVAETKPVIAYIRGLGASGAYYVGCAATRIVALPTALVGSIGVLSVRPILEALLQRFGVSVAVNKGGRLKDMGAFWRQPTPEEEQKLQELVEAYYDVFVQRVAKGRKLDEGRVRGYATGEVFLATRAKELGLVDELGNMERAQEVAAGLAKIKRRVVYLRPRRPFLRRLMGGMAQEMTQALVEEMETRLGTRVVY